MPMRHFCDDGIVCKHKCYHLGLIAVSGILTTYAPPEFTHFTGLPDVS